MEGVLQGILLGQSNKEESDEQARRRHWRDENYIQNFGHVN
jgi:hypothetical protein